MKLNEKSGGRFSGNESNTGESWRQVSMVIDGKSQPVDGETLVTSVDNEFTLTHDGVEVMKGKARFGSEETPNQQDVELDRGPDAGKTIRQIIKFEGDMMVVCNGPPDGERPTEFSSESGSGRTLGVWARVKP